MSRNEYLREIVKGELDAAHIREMLADGWKPRAVEWEREVRRQAKARRESRMCPTACRSRQIAAISRRIRTKCGFFSR